jgi:hypothetical protein
MIEEDEFNGPEEEEDEEEEDEDWRGYITK